MSHACLEDLDYSGRKLDRALIRQLAMGRWVAEHQNILITGPTGVGKSYLACALGQQACRQHHRVIYRRIPRLFPELTLAHGDGTYPIVLARFARVDVLILDDWGLVGLKDAQRQDLLEILTIATATDRRSSRVSCRSIAGMNTWEIPRWPMRFSTASSIAPIAWPSRARHDARPTATDPPRRGTPNEI
jgi:DNA replication protein DnaC